MNANRIEFREEISHKDRASDWVDQRTLAYQTLDQRCRMISLLGSLRKYHITSLNQILLSLFKETCFPTQYGFHPNIKRSLRRHCPLHAVPNDGVLIYHQDALVST